MSWDDDKSTAADPTDPAADEQVTADEWDAMVTDQKGRVPYGPVADRPSAGDASNGDVWLVTDLTNDAGVLTKLVSGAWKIMGLGSSSSPVPSVTTEKIVNAYDHIIGTSAELDTALKDAADAATSEVSILVGRGTYTPGNAPYDLSDTAVTFHGHFPQVSKETHDPDLTFTEGGGTIIDCENASALFTGNQLRGCSFRNFFIKNATDGLAFGATGEVGIYFSELENIYGIDVDDNLLNLINIQHVIGRHIKTRNSLRVLRIENDHADHDGANSVFDDLYVYGRATDAGDKPDGGILLKSTTGMVGNVDLYRPQTNLFLGTTGTGAGIKFDGTGTQSVGNCNIYGADLEGDVNNAVHTRGQVDGCSIHIGTAQTNNRTVYLETVSAAPNANYVQIETVPEAADIAESDDGRNYITGTVGTIAGSWTGMVYNINQGQPEMYVGRSTGIKIQLGVDTVFNSITADVGALKMATNFLSNNAGDEVGEVRRNSGDSQLYEWDGSSWQQLTGSNTITP